MPKQFCEQLLVGIPQKWMLLLTKIFIVNARNQPTVDVHQG